MLTLKSISLYLFCLLTSGLCSIQAQEQTLETNSLKPGAWALEFGISSNFTLVSFQGSSISAKYHTSTTSAWQAGITIYGNTENGSNLQMPVPGDTITSSNSSSNSYSSGNVSLRVQYIWYANSEGIIHFYTGAGPIVGYYHSQNDQQDILENGNSSSKMWSNRITSTTAKAWSFGASAMVGVEYFPAKVLSLHAEYVANLTYQDGKTEGKTSSTYNYGSVNYNGSNSSGGYHGWALGAAGVSFGLSVYF